MTDKNNELQAENDDASDARSGDDSLSKFLRGLVNRFISEFQKSGKSEEQFDEIRRRLKGDETD